MSGTNETTTEAKAPRKTSRRSLMRLAAPAAAGAAALAATGALRPGAAHAMPQGSGDGAIFNIGVSNQAASVTWLDNSAGPPGSGIWDDTLIVVNDADIAPAGGLRGHIAAITARTDDTAGGLVGGIGVIGVNGQPEVGNLAKLFGGVYGLTRPKNEPLGYGVIAHSIGGQAPLWIVPVGNTGATQPPNPASIFGSITPGPGAVYADSGGALWNVRNASNTAAWYEMSSVTFLGTAVRLLDTRGGSAVPYHGTIDVAAGGVGGIPMGAIAVFGTLIAALRPGVNCGDGSSAIAWAKGATRPASVNIVFNPGDLAGVYTSTFAMVALGTGGKFSIYNQPILPVGVDYIFDAFGFVI